MDNIILNDLCSPVNRGKRLKRIRNMANLSREELCDMEGLNATTYKGWEIGRFSGLSKIGAANAIKRVSKEGVICSLDWLLCGQGQSPSAVPVEHEQYTKKQNKSSLVLREIIVFQNNFDNVTYTEIVDDGSFPRYNIGDQVAGIKKYGDEIASILGEICIVHTINNKILVRRILQGSGKKTYVLLCTNPKTIVEKPVICNMKIRSAAPIMRHYKKS